MKIAPFGVEQWMTEYAHQCTDNLAETCVESLTVAQLLGLARDGDSFLDELLALKLTCGAIEGSHRLRAAVAARCERQDAGNVLIARGAIGAHPLVHLTLVEPGDRVVPVLPAYQPHYCIPGPP